MRTLIPAAVLVLLLASCRGDRAETEQTSPPPDAAPASTAAPSATVATSSTSGFEGVTEEGGTVKIAFKENGTRGELRGATRDTGKRKYTLGGGPVLYEVKPNDEGGFKLRTPDGKLLWKVKVTAEKIKISNNEQNENPFELKVRDGDRVKVVAPGDRELGNVRYASGKVEVETAGGKNIFTANAGKPTGAYGVLLLDGIPDRERFILIAEILSRGR
jgi:hypothetical protein